MKPYPKYKDSGVEWIGEVPEGWEILPIKYVVKIPVTDGPHETPELLNEGIPFISAEAIKNDKIDFGKKRGFISIEEHKRFSEKYKPQKGDIYMIKSGATTGNVAVVETDDEFNIWSPLAAIRPDLKKTTTKFLFHFMKSINFFESIEIGWSFGTQQNIGMGVIENLPIVAPSIEEQISIAAYLDRKTAQIDDLISKKQKITELLKEERAAIINQAVTKGLNPDAPMKDSGIEWIGEVPEGWAPVRTRFLLQNGYRGIKIGPFGSALKLQDMVQDGIKVYGQENVIANDFQLGDRFISQNKFIEMLVYEIKSGDILITMMGTCGQCRIVPDDAKTGIIDSHLIRLRVNEKLILPTYFRLLIDESKYVKHQIIMLGKGSIMHGLNSGIIKELLIILPPIKDQKSIAAYLDRKTSKIDQTISNIKKQIDLLKEFRTALISEVVTGKIDVRDEESR